MQPGDQTNHGSGFGDVPETQVRGPDSGGSQTESWPPIQEREIIVGNQDTARGAAPQAARVADQASKRWSTGSTVAAATSGGDGAARRYRGRSACRAPWSRLAS